MTLSRRMLLAFLAVVTLLGTAVVVMVDRRVSQRLDIQVRTGLLREAHLVGAAWISPDQADALADSLGARIAHRVTLIDTTGRVVGDSEFDGPALTVLDNHAGRPEVEAALRTGSGTDRRISASAGALEMYAAVRHPLGVARVSMSVASHRDFLGTIQRDILRAALFASGVALLLAWGFSRSVVRPILELRDDAQAIAEGDLTRRPSLAAPGEVGQLASAFHRLAEELTLRVQSLEADDALMRAVTESLNEGIVVVDEQRRVQEINDVARRLLGARDALPFATDLLPRDGTLREAMNAGLRGDATTGAETMLGDRHVALTARPLSTGGCVVALFDLTAVRRLEAVRRDFVANVSHELKTPLTIIGGFAETLRGDDVPADQRRQFIETIATSTERMQRLVDDLLDLSRIESGGWRPAPTTADVAGVATEVLAAIRHDAETRGIALQLAVDPSAATVWADPTALRQILANLTNNALRHTTQGTITVFSEAGAAGTTIGVRDTGSGIAPEHLPRVFERFYRVDASRSRIEGGTGLGLAIVKHLAEAHGGRATAESAVGVGTTVRVTFPPPGARS